MTIVSDPPTLLELPAGLTGRAGFSFRPDEQSALSLASEGRWYATLAGTDDRMIHG